MQCLAVNEEEIFAIQNEQSLFPVGWIHVCVPIFSFQSLLSSFCKHLYEFMVVVNFFLFIICLFP